MIPTENTLTNTNTGTVPSLLHFLIQVPRTSTCTDRRTGRTTPGQGESGAASSSVRVFITCSSSKLSTVSSDPQLLLGFER